MVKNSQNYEVERQTSFEHEEKLVKIDDFKWWGRENYNGAGWKKEKKRREIAEKNKVLKRQKKADEEKIEEVEFWQQLKTVNKEFKNISNGKKKTKKMWKTVLK